jgi:hypothetical protein
MVVVMTSKNIRLLSLATPLVVIITAILLHILVSTAFASSSSHCLAKDTTIIVDVYSGMTRTIPFKAYQTSNTVQGISVVLKC